MKFRVLKRGLTLALLASIGSTAMAHTGHETSGLASGFGHPIGGLDHLLAMVAVGLWAAHLGGKALWAVPAAFVGTMLLGGALGASGVQLPYVEQGIVLSVIVLGLCLAGAARFPAALCAALAGVFALFHGVAHGAEMPVSASGISYAAGFAVATALLHLAGIALSKVVTPFNNGLVNRIAGAGIAAAGTALAFA